MLSFFNVASGTLDAKFIYHFIYADLIYFEDILMTK